jgi:hypothetical protein
MTVTHAGQWVGIVETRKEANSQHTLPNVCLAAVLFWVLTDDKKTKRKHNFVAVLRKLSGTDAFLSEKQLR